MRPRRVLLILCAFRFILSAAYGNDEIPKAAWKRPIGKEYKDNIQSDQLAGQWYADMTGLGDIVPKEMTAKSLKNIYDFNVMKFAKGEMGAVNGIATDGTIITTNEQVQEVWTGTTLGLAGFMLGEGVKDEAYRTAWGIYHVNYETKGYWFRTPKRGTSREITALRCTCAPQRSGPWK